MKISMLFWNLCTRKIKRNNLIIILLILAGSTFIFYRQNAIERISLQDWLANHEYHNYDVNTEIIEKNQSCHIHNYHPFEPSILKYVEKLPPLKCSYDVIELTYIDDHGILRIDWKNLEKFRLKISMCEYSEVLRDNSTSADTYKLNTSKVFTDAVDVTHTDFVYVQCKSYFGFVIYSNYHLHIRDLPIDKTVDLKNKYNVMFFGIDSLSRLNAMRQLPKTYSFVKNNMKSFILRGYNKISFNTYPNLAAVLTGVNPYDTPHVYSPLESENKPHDPWPFLWKNFSRAGYRTLFAEDKTIYNTFHYMKGGFGATPTDHYLRTYWNAVESSVLFHLSKQYCYGNQVRHKLTIDYIRKYMKKLDGKVPFWGLLFMTDICHGQVNTIGLADLDISNFFKELHSTKILNNTIFIFFSDHGERYDHIRETYVGGIEDKMPLFTIYFPPSFHKLQPQAMKNFQKNQMRLTTAFDVYCTMIDVLKLSKNPSHKLGNFRYFSGISLFSEIPKNRTCKTANIDGQYCTCRAEKLLKNGDPITVIAADIIINYVNNLLLTKYGNFKTCARLIVSEILESYIFDDSPSSDDKEFEISVKVRTRPNDAILEGSLKVNRANTQDMKMIGNVERINRYGDQSKCIEDSLLRFYCYCIV